MDGILDFLKFLVMAVIGLFALLTVLVVVISLLPGDNPLRGLLGAFAKRIAAMLAVGAIAIPVEPIPGLDVMYDVAVPVLLLYYWFTFFKEVRAFFSARAPSRPIRMLE